MNGTTKIRLNYHEVVDVLGLADNEVKVIGADTEQSYSPSQLAAGIAKGEKYRCVYLYDPTEFDHLLSMECVREDVEYVCADFTAAAYLSEELLAEYMNNLGAEFSVAWRSGKCVLLKNKSYRKRLIGPTGAWQENGVLEHVFDEDLCMAVCDFFVSEDCDSVIDMGCGPGKYVEMFKRVMRGSVYGVDGNPNTPELSGGACYTVDLSEPVSIGRGKYSAVLSLEVGEHIPAEFESAFLDNLASHADAFIVLSWAVPGQDGFGHVNCQPNQYVIEQMDVRGFRYLSLVSYQLRVSAKEDWFKDTVMVFKKYN